MFVVIIRPDYDCDGYSEGYHRVSVTPSEAALLSSPQAVRKGTHTEFIAQLMRDDRAGFSDDPSGCYVMHWQDFRTHVWPKLSRWSRGYWRRAGYTSLKGGVLRSL